MAKSSIKNPDTYEALRDDGASKAKAAAIANAQANDTIDQDSRPYEERTVNELRSLASKRSISGRSGMRKHELIDALRQDNP